MPVAIGRRALDVLGLLIERPGDLVSRGAIIETVWGRTAVEDGNLNVQVAALRRILDRDREQGSCIQTVSGRGYRFVAAVTPQNLAESFGDRGTAPHGPGEQPEDARPVGLYTLSTEADAALPKTEVKATFSAARPFFPRRPLVAVAVAGLLVIAGALWCLWSSQKMVSISRTASNERRGASAAPVDRRAAFCQSQR